MLVGDPARRARPSRSSASRCPRTPGSAPGRPGTRSGADAAGRPARTSPAPAAGWSPRPAPPDARRPAHPAWNSRTPAPADRACGSWLARPSPQATAQRRRHDDHARQAATRGTARWCGRTGRPAGHAPDGELITAGRSPPAGPVMTGIPGDPAAARRPGCIGYAIRPRAFPASPGPACLPRKAHPASTASDLPISAYVTAQSIPEGCCTKQRTYRVDLPVDQRLYPLTYLTHRVGDLRRLAAREASRGSHDP